MKRRLHVATVVAAICLFVSLDLGFTLLTRDGSQRAAVDVSFAPSPRVSPAVPMTEVPPVNDRALADRPMGQLTATSSFDQLVALEQAHTVRPQTDAAPDVAPQRILTAADSVLPDEL
jgi:hypothetical protein